MAKFDTEDPIIISRYVVELGAESVGYFTEVSGLEAQIEVFEYQEGGENSFTHKLPVRTKFSNVTLKRGVLGTDNRLWDWFKSATQGKIERQNISIVLYSQDYQEIRRWNLTDAYPVKWTLPQFRAGDNAVAIEALELAHTGFSPN